MTSEFVKDVAINEQEEYERLHRRFITGLKEDYGMTNEQIFDIEQNWLYCGYRHNESEWSDGASLFKCYFPREDFPEFSKECVCRQKLLVRNDWITDGKEVLIIGQCCKDMFIKNRLKTCSICKTPHKNRSDNYCNDCRMDIKIQKITCKCGYKKKESENMCNDCYILSQACRCGKYKKTGYKQCYSCFNASSENKKTNKQFDLFILEILRKKH